MSFTELNPEEKFQWGKKAIERGEIDDGINAITIAAYDGCAEAKKVNGVIWSRKQEEQSKAYEAIQQFLLGWLQGEDSPLKEGNRRSCKPDENRGDA